MVSGERSELPVKVRHRLKAAFISSLRDRNFFLRQQLTGMSNPYLAHEIRKGFIGVYFKVAAE